jgi:hypothetical protein
MAIEVISKRARSDSRSPDSLMTVGYSFSTFRDEGRMMTLPSSAEPYRRRPPPWFTLRVLMLVLMLRATVAAPRSRAPPPGTVMATRRALAFTGTGQARDGGS